MSDTPSIDDFMCGGFQKHSYLKPIRLMAETESTNTLALEAQKDGTPFLADVQTEGRGRRGNDWHSAPGKGLWLSVCLKGEPQGLTFLAALALLDSLTSLAEKMNCATRPTLKWPNDLLWDGKKCAGILVEHRNGYCALGIGLNVNHSQADFPDELQSIATSLAIATGQNLDRKDVLVALLEQLNLQIKAHRTGQQEQIWKRWSKACNVINRTISCAQGTGIVESVNRDGSLQVFMDKELVRITDEITVLQQ